ncbi:isoprenylcysteine carboxylmethyltransferase family protein [Salinadaptatus halalkaliphilus]|uniref:Isoprenylcysteine carboxylmethyltransferase family protein n=1 Tax=Salinadaptatus halalkaliphilus TaxID=2419781 RepID=A0A4S3TMT4_9EURY|nr:isoprenylcysteine carboxylmethyltransferase family protein [Salinadaptatus halalkaliphilus]THE65542.1 isoprenylcysteine carboxylmethyltransferase family protein [Salinadaptatus halalkaliphilus]
MTETLEWVLLGAGLGAMLANLAGVVSSIRGWTSYYPLGEKDWRFTVFWGLAHVSNGALLGLAYIQFGELGLPWWAFPVGLVLFVGGFAIVIVATSDLGVSQTQGITDGLRTDRLYRYSRNPQYVGYIPVTIGYVLFTDAPFVVPICAVWLVWWFVLPFAEEPWLRDQFGHEYEQYAEQIPRFVGGNTVRRLLTDAGMKGKNNK